MAGCTCWRYNYISITDLIIHDLIIHDLIIHDLSREQKDLQRYCGRAIPS